MASGTIQRDVVFPSSGSFKLPNGIIVAWGMVDITTSTQGSGATFAYRGAVDVSITPYGISTIIAAFSNIQDGAGFWNSTALIRGTNLNVTAAGNSNTTKTAYWLAIGT